MERPSETCRVLFQINKFEKLVHLVGFTIEIKTYSSLNEKDYKLYEASYVLLLNPTF